MITFLLYFPAVKLEGTYEGHIFDDRQLSFNLGEGEAENVIEGIEVGLEKFKKGETSKLIIKPKFAFGNEGSSLFGVPANATIEYVVTLISFEKVK